MSAPSPFWPASSPCCRLPRPARICFPTGAWAPAAGLKARPHPEVQTAKAIRQQPGNTESREEEEHVYSRLHCFIHFAIATALALAALAASGQAPAASPPAPPVVQAP